MSKRCPAKKDKYKTGYDQNPHEHVHFNSDKFCRKRGADIGSKNHWDRFFKRENASTDKANDDNHKSRTAL